MFAPRWLVFGFVAVHAAKCLNNYTEVPKNNLVNPNGETYPLGIYVQNWAAGRAMSYMAGIVIEEVFGYNISYNGPGPDTPSGIFAVAGCTTPENAVDRGCGASVTYNHVNLENWRNGGFEGIWQQAQGIEGMEPKDLSSTGYSGKISIYMPSPVRETAYFNTGLPLEYYEAWDVNWRKPWLFFDELSTLNRSDLKLCSNSNHYVAPEVQNFLDQTGDLGGVRTLPDGSVVGNCFDDYVWLAPACRNNASQCVLFITGGNGWSMDEMQQKAVKWNMPLAIAIAADWSKFTPLPLNYASTFYWWVPDPTFLDLKPVELIFPQHDRLAFQRGEKTTQADAVGIRVVVSRDLFSLAPRVESFLAGINVDIDTVNSLLLENKAGTDMKDVVCNWLNANTQTWRAWLPDDTKCFAGFGLFNTASGQYVSGRENREGLRCQACPSGTFSTQLIDNDGQTFVCSECPRGTSQPSGAQTSCEPCGAGEYQDETGKQACKRCAVGYYQETEGAAMCASCPEGSRTLGPGATFKSDCGCSAGRIDISETGELLCAECSEGLLCPLMGTKTSLLTGSHSLDPDYVATVQEGYYADPALPLAVFKCGALAHCPGGTPGTCAGGRTGIPCAECPQGRTWSEGKCNECEAWRQVAWVIAGLCGFLFLTIAYYLMTSKVTAKATVLFTTTCAFGMLISLLQSIGIIGMMTVDFPADLKGFLSFFQILLLDLDSFGFACFAGADTGLRYWVSILFFPAALAWLASNYAVSQFFPRRRWDLTKTASCMGQVLQVGFSTMSTIALAPLMCYTHPNNLQSVLKYPNVICGSEQHTIMLIGGWLLLVFGVLGFLALCTYAAFMVPHWSAQERHHLVRCFRFLVFRFRLDSWWFGVPLLTRGPLISLPIVLATDYQSIQTIFVTLILAAFLVTQAMAWPWKVPMLNALDCWMSFCILVLVAGTALYVEPVSKGLTSNFVNAFSVTIMVIIFTSVGSMLIMSISALLFRSALGGNSELSIYNLQKPINADRIAEKMKDMAELLAGMEEQELAMALDSLSVFDTRRITSFMTLTGAELLPSRLSKNFAFNTRVSSASFQSKRAEEVRDDTPG